MSLEWSYYAHLSHLCRCIPKSCSITFGPHSSNATTLVNPGSSWSSGEGPLPYPLSPDQSGPGPSDPDSCRMC